MIFKKLTDLFPFWILIGSVLALFHPPLFTWFSGPWIPLGLAMIMLGMGLTLTAEDFRAVFREPLRPGVGVVLQFLIMPLLGFLLAFLFRLPTEFAVGLILVSCCPGGTASNVISYLAKANVSLSVSMTAVSTLTAVILTPLLTTILAGSRMDVNGWGLLMSTVQVVILPVGVGVLINTFFSEKIRAVQAWTPFMAVIFIVLIVASIVGSSKALILESGLMLIAAILCLHLFGFLIGYFLGKKLASDEQAARTISIEVGMQNSGLGVVLAKQNFANPAVAVPSAISSVVHSLLGSFAASKWRKDSAA